MKENLFNYLQNKFGFPPTVEGTVAAGLGAFDRYTKWFDGTIENSPELFSPLNEEEAADFVLFAERLKTATDSDLPELAEWFYTLVGNHWRH